MKLRGGQSNALNTAKLAPGKITEPLANDQDVMSFHPIAAVLVHVLDCQAGLDWYQAAFSNAKRVWIESEFEFLDIDGVQVEIVPSDEKVSSGAAGTVVYWRVEDLNAALEHFESLGASLYRGPMEIENSLSMCQVRDPWGNCIGLRGPRIAADAYKG
jgi:predicted enzyme related to lactoylglutathione lyase